MEYYYTYLLIGLDHRLYIGARKCKCLPELDIYWGSFTDKTFKPISKHIQEIWSTKEEALAHEIRLHSEFDVAVNPLFANRAKQTSIGFSTAGITRTKSIEERAKLSKANKGRRCSQESRLKMSLAKKNKPMSEKAKEARRGKITPNETKIKLKKAYEDNPHSDRKLYNWSHTSGDIQNAKTVGEMARLFGLIQKNLHQVSTKKRKSCSGWKLLILETC